MNYIKQLFTKKEQTKKEDCDTLLRAFICLSRDEPCMTNYIKRTLTYECRLRNGEITLEEYKNKYNPHYTMGYKFYNSKIEIGGKEYNDDKQRRIINFMKYGRFEL